MGRFGSFLWNGIRLPVLVVLVVLEPIVSTILGLLAMLGLLMTGFFTLYGVAHFPSGTMFLISLGFAMILLLYEATIQWLSR